MQLIPAIDLKDDKCVRLCQGKMDEETIYSDDPIAVAEGWVKAGAERIHIVDLNGATTGKPIHLPIIAEIAKKFPELTIQVGGGIRDEDMVQTYLDIGVNYVVLGTRAITQPHFVKDLCLEFPNHIIIGLDVRDNKVATAGWSKLVRHDVIDLAQHFENDGVVAIIFTDITRDGMLTGVNIESTVQLASALNIPVIASGGVASMEDIKALCQVKQVEISGIITGRALYEKTLDFKQAQEYIQKHVPHKEY